MCWLIPEMRTMNRSTPTTIARASTVTTLILLAGALLVPAVAQAAAGEGGMPSMTTAIDADSTTAPATSTETDAMEPADERSCVWVNPGGPGVSVDTRCLQELVPDPPADR